MNRAKGIIYGCVLTFLLSSNAWAGADPVAELSGLVNKLQEQMTQMQDTIRQQNDKIELLQSQVAERSTGGAMIAGGQATQGSFDENLRAKIGDADKWLKDLRFSGDFRLRYEAFHFTSASAAETDDRNRFRYRLRFGFDKKLGKEFNVGVGFISGETAGTGADSGLQVDPTSTNTSFDNLFNYKDIFIDKAFAVYNPEWAIVGPVEKLEIGGGKFTNPFEKGSSELVWDRDVKPEGVYEKAELALLDTDDVDVKGYAIAGQFVLDEDATGGSSADSELFAYQGGLKLSVRTPFAEEPVGFLSAFSFYDYLDYAQASNFTIGATSLARGNSNFVGPGTELDAEDFNIIEWYNESSFDLYQIPLRPFVDVAHNAANESDQNDEAWAWALGTKVGDVKKKGDWELGYSYRRIENDSVVGAFNDSDFGLGFAGKRGNQIKLAYALTDFLQLNGAVSFVNNLATGTSSVRDEEQRRFQLDLLWKF